MPASLHAVTIQCALDAAASQHADVLGAYAVPAMFDNVEHAWVLLYDGPGQYRVTTHRSDEGNEFGQGFRFDRLPDALVAWNDRCRRAMQDQAIWAKVLVDREKEAARAAAEAPTEA